MATRSGSSKLLRLMAPKPTIPSGYTLRKAEAAALARGQKTVGRRASSALQQAHALQKTGKAKALDEELSLIHI